MGEYVDGVSKSNIQRKNILGRNIRKMILMTLGSQKFQFNRLLMKVDELIEQGVIRESVFAQAGASDYIPRNYEHEKFMDYEKLTKMQERADLILTHGGTGSIVGALKKGKKVIAVPRLARYGEHVDDHQMQVVKELEKMKVIVACYDVEKLGEALDAARHADLRAFRSECVGIASDIEQYLKTIRA